MGRSRESHRRHSSHSRNRLSSSYRKSGYDSSSSDENKIYDHHVRGRERHRRRRERHRYHRHSRSRSGSRSGSRRVSSVSPRGSNGIHRVSSDSPRVSSDSFRVSSTGHRYGSVSRRDSIEARFGLSGSEIIGYKCQPPNKTIMLRRIDEDITEFHIQREIVACGMNPKYIKVVRRRDSGVSLRYAFVDFATVKEASEWMHMKKGVLKINQNSILMQFARPGGNSLSYSKDWFCIKCGYQNFQIRMNCRKCSSRQEESQEGNQGRDEICKVVTKTLIITNLDVLTTEDSIWNFLRATIPDLIKNITSLYIGKDPLTSTSRGICYIEMENVEDARRIVEALEKPFTIDEKMVNIFYCKFSIAEIKKSYDDAKTEIENVVHCAATSKKGHYNSNLYHQEIPNGTDGKIYPVPDISSYVYDVTSRYYFCPKTRLYYDSFSNYYWNSKIQKWLRWDHDNQTYALALDYSSANISQSSERVGKRHSKVNISKKIAKDVERWSKINVNKHNSLRDGIRTTPSNSLTAFRQYTTEDEECLKSIEKNSQQIKLFTSQNLEECIKKIKIGNDDVSKERKDPLEVSESNKLKKNPANLAPGSFIGDENIGKRLLQKIGWREGQGLGKQNQGRISPISAVRYIQSEGLGNVREYSSSYKACVKKSLYARYHQLDKEQN